MATDENNLAQAAAKELPDTLIGLVVAVVATILLGLAFPGSVLWVFPLVAMFGFRIMLLGKRCNSYLSLPLGLSPFAIFVAGLAMAQIRPPERYCGCTRLVLGLYIVFFMPLALYVSAEVRRWGGPAPPLTRRIAGVLARRAKYVLPVVVFGVFAAFRLGGLTTPPDSDPVAVLSKADVLWALGDPKDRIEATKQYKLFLRGTMCATVHSVCLESHHDKTSEPAFSQLQGFEKDLPRVYRRVIEYEADYGDPGEAVDWIRSALDDRVGISLTSEKANELLEKVRKGMVR